MEKWTNCKYFYPISNFSSPVMMHFQYLSLYNLETLTKVTDTNHDTDTIYKLKINSEINNKLIEN